jgi:isopentenyldiphosphate isomerase
LKPLFKLEASDATGQEFVWVYRCDSDGPFNLNKEEIEKGDWFSPAELDKWLEKRPQDFAPSFPIIWRRWQRAEK